MIVLSSMAMDTRMHSYAWVFKTVHILVIALEDYLDCMERDYTHVHLEVGYEM